MAALRHIALVVRDLDRSFEFYRRIFGLQQVRHRPGRAIHVSDGCFNLALLGKRDRTSEEIKNDVEIDSAGAVGFSHFGFQVESLESVLGKLSQLGRASSARKRPQDGRFVEERINDPEGNRLEIYALVTERDNARINRPLDLDKSLDEIVAQASGLTAAGGSLSH